MDETDPAGPGPGAGSGATTPRSPSAGGRRRRALRWSLAGVTFVVGLLVGGVVVGIATGRPTAVPQAAAPSPTSPAPGSAGPAGPSSAGATGQVVVNDACLRAINAAQDVYRSLDDLVDAARDLDAARLDEVVRRLEPLQARLQASVPDCRVSTRLPDGSVITGTPAPTAPATGTATPGG